MEYKINAVIFDYGGVISLPRDKRTFENICRLLKISNERLEAVYYKTRADYDRGVVTAADYWKGIIGLLEIHNISDNDMEKLIGLDVKSWRKINNDTVGLIRNLKRLSYKLAILSNMTYETLPIINKSAWMKCFDVRVFSCEEKISKPDEKIYKTVLARLGEKPENTLFIDDSAVNIEAAKSLGINGIHYESTEQLALEMETILI